jgi:hypothetical protein
MKLEGNIKNVIGQIIKTQGLRYEIDLRLFASLRFATNDNIL